MFDKIEVKKIKKTNVKTQVDLCLYGLEKTNPAGFFSNVFSNYSQENKVALLKNILKKK